MNGVGIIMYLYFLDYGDFVKVGLTKDLQKRLPGIKVSFKKDYISQSSYFWKADSYYISFVEGHIKKRFPNYVFGSIGEEPGGFTEIFNKTDSEEIKRILNIFFGSLKIEYRSGMIENELKAINLHGYVEESFKTEEVKIDDFIHFVSTHTRNVKEISDTKEEVKKRFGEEWPEERFNVNIKLKRLKQNKITLIDESGVSCGGSSVLGRKTDIHIYGNSLNERQLQILEQVKKVIS